MMGALVILALGVVALVYVLRPLKDGPRGDVPLNSVALEDALERKRTAFGALIDIEEERSIGKMSSDDYASLRREYEAEALEALNALDQMDATQDDPLEAEIAEFRNKMACPACGAPRRSGGVCERCGEQP